MLDSATPVAMLFHLYLRPGCLHQNLARYVVMIPGLSITCVRNTGCPQISSKKCPQISNKKKFKKK
jgi:hypothetical protein